MARRGASLREHILDTAKLAFLEAGYERTSMDAIATRAETSKRSLYAHFPTKEVLFLAVVDRVDELFRGRMGTPGEYADEPVDAAALYCARYLQMLSWESAVQTCRLGITAAVPFPEASVQLHRALFDGPAAQLADYLGPQLGLARDAAAALAAELVAATVDLHVPGLLFGAIAPNTHEPDAARLADDVDVAAIRQVVQQRLPSGR